MTDMQTKETLEKRFPKEVTDNWSSTDIAEAFANCITPEGRQPTCGEVVEARNFFDGVIYKYGQRVLFDE